MYWNSPAIRISICYLFMDIHIKKAREPVSLPVPRFEAFALPTVV